MYMYMYMYGAERVASTCTCMYMYHHYVTMLSLSFLLFLPRIFSLACVGEQRLCLSLFLFLHPLLSQLQSLLTVFHTLHVHVRMVVSSQVTTFPLTFLSSYFSPSLSLKVPCHAFPLFPSMCSKNRFPLTGL